MRAARALIGGVALLGAATLLATCADTQQTCSVNGVLKECWNYVCDNGLAVAGLINAQNHQLCSTCNTGFTKNANNLCVATVYTCLNGTAPTGTPSGSSDVERCQSCANGYTLSGAAGAAGTTCVKDAVSTATCAANASATPSVKLIWGDADYSSTDCAEITLKDPAFESFVDGSGITDGDEASGGADSSSTNRKIELTTAGALWGGTAVLLDAEQDYSAAGWVLKIAIKSPSSGGNSKIKAKLESLETPANPNDPIDISTQELEKSFTNDGTWQTVEWPISEFSFSAAKIDQSKIGKVEIVLSDANGATAGIGAQTIYYDEIRFERAIGLSFAEDSYTLHLNRGSCQRIYGDAAACGDTTRAQGFVVGTVHAVNTSSNTLIYDLSGSGAADYAVSSSGVITVDKAGGLTGLDTASSVALTLTATAGSLSEKVTVTIVNAAGAPTDVPPNATEGFAWDAGTAGTQHRDNLVPTEETNGGALGSSKNYKLTLTDVAGNPEWAVFLHLLAADLDVTGTTLRVEFKSPASGGNGKIKVKLEGARAVTTTNEVEKTFTNDGTWQTVEWPVSGFSFMGGFTPQQVQKVIFILSPAAGATGGGLGSQIIYYDEVRFF